MNNIFETESPKLSSIMLPSSHNLEPKIMMLVDRYRDEIVFAKEKDRQGQTIYRGTFMTDPIRLVDPSIRGPRKSANTNNLYTLWMSNNPQWAEFPRRDQSSICSNKHYTADSYGSTLVVVVPIRNCQIGICPGNDLWHCFDKRWPLGGLEEFVVAIENFIKLNWNISIDGGSYVDMIKTFRFVDKQLETTGLENIKGKDGFSIKYILTLLLKCGTLEKLFEYVLDPKANKFKTMSWYDYKLSRNQEIWFSDVCLFIDKPFWDTKLDFYLSA